MGGEALDKSFNFNQVCPGGIQGLIRFPSWSVIFLPLPVFTTISHLSESFASSVAGTGSIFTRTTILMWFTLRIRLEGSAHSSQSQPISLRPDQATYRPPTIFVVIDLSHPVKIPAITLEITWRHDQIGHGGEVLAGNLALANGDTTGYGFHGDFTNGWVTEVLQAALNNPQCTSGASLWVLRST